MRTGYKKEPAKLDIKTVKEAFSLFLRFNSYILRYWKAEAVILAAGFFSMALSLLTPYLGKLILDNGILGRNMAFFLKFTIIGGVIYLFQQVSEKGSSWLRDTITRRIRTRLARDVFNRVGKISIQSFQGASVGECVSRISGDTAASANIIATTLPDLIKTVLRLVLITFIIFAINAKLLLFIVIYQAVVIARIRFFTKRQEELEREGYEKSWEMSRTLNQLFSQIYFVKISGNIAAMIRKYFKAFTDIIRLEARASRLEAASDIFSEASSKIFFGAVGFIGTLFVIKGGMTLGSLSAVVAYLSQGAGAYMELFGQLQRIVLNRISLERTAELLDEPIYVKEAGDARITDLSRGGVEFRDVTFGYDGSRAVLDKINFMVMPGTKAALVGLSGCGKTTIVNLMLRLYDVNAGKIILGGTDIRQIRFRSLYGQIGVAPQSPLLWNGSIREIIAYDNSKVNESAMIEAAKLAEIHSFITGLPERYDTVLADMVSRISQGQRQRLAIAAALAKRPKMLILDEASSSLDSKTEERIIDNIKETYPDLTLVLISHRLSAVRKMDMVYFLSQPGRMHAASHAELTENDAKYRELFAGQLDLDTSAIV